MYAAYLRLRTVVQAGSSTPDVQRERRDPRPVPNIPISGTVDGVRRIDCRISFFATFCYVSNCNDQVNPIMLTIILDKEYIKKSRVVDGTIFFAQVSKGVASTGPHRISTAYPLEDFSANVLTGYCPPIIRNAPVSMGVCV